MHKFGSGHFEGLTVEQAMLRDAPILYRIMEWARQDNIRKLKNAVQDFERLRSKLRKATITARCAKTGCTLPVQSMTLPIDREGWYRPSPCKTGVGSGVGWVFVYLRRDARGCVDST